MTTRSKFSIALLLLIVAGAGFIWKFSDQLVLTLMQRQVENTLSNRFMDELPDGLHVYICGAGSPIPDPHRAGPCTAVIAGDNLFTGDLRGFGDRCRETQTPVLGLHDVGSLEEAKKYGIIDTVLASRK